MTAPGHGDIYGAAELYDLAFSYRDYAHEAAFLRRTFEDRAGRPPARFLELAAGPGRHALAMAATGVASTCVDLSPAMSSYARGLAERHGVALACVTADMRSFELADRFELAACMLCSATYLLTDADFIAHLKAVARCLGPDGRYILELPHPGDHDGAGTTKDAWTVQSEAGALEVTWRELAASRTAAGPTIIDCLARLVFTPTTGPRVIIEQRSSQRAIPRAELEHLVAASGAFALEHLWGALDPTIELEGPRAWRMVAVLRATT
jgi:SAM-dependent methyltransferase